MVENAFKADWPSFALGFNTGKKKGGVELNIAYGDTPPEDTSKLWVKSEMPTAIEVRADDRVFELSATLSAWGQGMTAAVVENKIYVFGGSGSPKEIQRVDIETGERVTLSSANFSRGLRDATCAAVGTKIYIFGGTENQSSYLSTQVLTKKIYQFDTETERISELSIALPSAGRLGSCAVVGRYIYLSAFATSTSTSAGSTDIYRFDTEYLTCESTTKSLPYGRHSTACAAVGSIVYWFGGRSTNTFQDSVFYYNTETEVVGTVSKNLPAKLAGAGCAVIGGKIYLIGGEIGNRGIKEDSQNTVFCFDPETSEIKKNPFELPTTLSYFGCVTVGTDIYTIGGKINLVDNLVTVTEAIYCVPTIAPLPYGVLWVSQNDQFQSVDLIKSDNLLIRVGVIGVNKGNADGKAETVEAFIYKDDEWVTV